MILIRKAARIATMVGSSLGLAYLGLNQVTGEVAAFMVIVASIEMPLEWAKAWPAPQDEHTLQRMSD